MENNTGKFLAGYAMEDLTPDYSVPLAGFGNSWRRMSETILSHILCQCTAMVDEKGTALLMYTIDHVKVRPGFLDAVAEHFNKAYGIPDAYIHISASHSESAPDTQADMEKCPFMEDYNKMCVEKLIACGEAALKDLAPAKLSYGSDHVFHMNFVKHAFLDTGVSIGDNKGSASDGRVLRHTTKVDDMLLLVRIEREGRKPIIFANWRAHNQFTSGATKTFLCADYVGAFRDAVDDLCGSELQFFQGSAGNVNPYSYIRSEERTRNYVEYGKMMAQHTQDILQRMIPIEAGLIKANKVWLQAPINHSEDDKYEVAKEVRKFYLDTPDQSVSRQFAIEHGFHSTYHAMAVCRRKEADYEMIDYPVSVWSIGDLGFNCTQYETFDTNGKFIRDNSPFAQQFDIGYTDYPSAYMPSGYGYEYGCYEADNSMFSCGTGERTAAKTVQMLIDLKYQR